MSARTLLLVDDDPGVLRSLRWCFTDYQVLTATDRPSALEVVHAHQPPVVTLDLGLPPVPEDAAEGLRALEEILAVAPQTKVIMVTGNEERRHAVQAIGLGAWDFYQKPIDPEILALIVGRAFNVYELEAEQRRLHRNIDGSFFGIITGSAKMQAVCRTIEKVAPTGISVLLLGESGTGKELIARALHSLSGRGTGPFVAINCAAIPDTLLESELFGHEKGAFTGAVRQVKGKIELAHQGTLFLDEIGDMPLPLQAKLLRFLQDRVIERVGGRECIPVDVRIVSATHRQIKARIEEGAFREDLFYRIGEIPLEIPPLRHRDDDAVVLAQHFADRFATQHGKPRLRLSAAAIAAIRQHRWSGNVRELENRIKRAVILAEDSAVTAADMDLAAPARSGPERPGGVPTLRQVREEAERAALRDALAEAQGNISVAARLLGISRPTIYNLLRQYDVKWPG